MRYALHLRILSLRRRDDLLSFAGHLGQTADFDDILVIDVRPDPAAPVPAVSACWNAAITGPISAYRPDSHALRDDDPVPGSWAGHVPLPATAAPVLGEDARIRLTMTPWG